MTNKPTSPNANPPSSSTETKTAPNNQVLPPTPASTSFLGSCRSVIFNDFPKILSILRKWLGGIPSAGIIGLSSQMAFEFMFLLAPGMLFFASLLGVLGMDPATLNSIVKLLKEFLPSKLHEVIDQQIVGIILTGSSGKIFFIGILLALYLGITFISTVTHALNKGHGIHESKGFLEQQIISLFLMFWFALIILFSFNASVFGDRLVEIINLKFQLQLPLQSLILSLKYPVIFVALTTLALMLYLLTPDVYQTVKQALPGAMFFSLGWLTATWLFKVYVDQFAHYNELYVALAGFIVLMLWTWVTSFLLLVGGKLNAAICEENRLSALPPPPSKT